MLFNTVVLFNILTGIVNGVQRADLKTENMNQSNIINDRGSDIIYITSSVYLVLVGISGTSLNGVALIKAMRVS